MFAQHVASIGMARVIKDRNPAAVTLLGGANCEAPMGSVIAQEVDAIDAVFSGPALHTFPQFLQQLLAGAPEGIHRIPGVLTAENCRDPRYVQAVGRDRDINDFFTPDYSGFVEAFSANQDRLGGPETAKPILFFETSRGCWWGQRSHCTFCGLNGLGMDYRAMAPEKAREQFDWLFGFSPWCVEFVCTDNIMPKSYPKEVFAEFDTPEGVSLFYEIKVPMSEHDMAVLTNAGVTRIQPGIEALATDTLKLMGKGTTALLDASGGPPARPGGDVPVVAGRVVHGGTSGVGGQATGGVGRSGVGFVVRSRVGAGAGLGRVTHPGIGVGRVGVGAVGVVAGGE